MAPHQMAELVVLGHAHVATEHATYMNTGSFAFPRGLRGRPLIVIEDTDKPRPERVLFGSV